MENVATKSDEKKDAGMQSHTMNHDGAAQEIRDEAIIHMGVRRELGPEYEDEVVDSFVEKVHGALGGGGNRSGAARVRGELPDHPGASPALLASTICMGIPLTAVAAVFVGLPGILAVWGAILLLAIYGGGDRSLTRDNEF